MRTEFDIGDLVEVPCKITNISVLSDGRVMYHLLLPKSVKGLNKYAINFEESEYLESLKNIRKDVQSND